MAEGNALQKYAEILGQTFLYASGSTVLALILGVLLAASLFRVGFRGARMASILLAVAAFLPLHIYAAAWLGALSAPAMARAVAGWPALATACLITGLARVPLAAFLMGILLAHSSPAQEEAAWIDTSRWGVLSRMVFPALLRSALLPATLVFALTAGEMAITDLLNIRTAAETAYITFQLTLDPASVTGAVALVYLPILVPCAALIVLVVRRQGGLLEIEYSQISSVFKKAAWWERTASGGVAVAILGLTLGFPFLALGSRLDPSWAGLAMAPELLFSAGIASAAALLALFLATWICTLAARRRLWLQIVTAGAWFGLMIPGALVGIWLAKMFNSQAMLRWMYDSPAILVLAQTIRSFPVAILVASAVVSVVPREMLDLLRLEGVSTVQRILHVYVPVFLPRLACAWLILFAWCLGELDASLIVCPPGLTTFPIRMFTMMHYGIYGDVAAGIFFLSLLVAILTGGAMAIMRCMKGRDDSRTNRA